MRGRDDRSEGFFSYVRLEERIPKDHALRPIRGLADKALASLTRRFEGLYSTMGRPSKSPEMLLRATLLQAFFSVRSKRMLHTYPALGPTGQQLRRRHLVAPAPPDDAESSATPTSPNEAYGHGQLVKALGTTRHQY
jgi:hypothetical protein